MGAALKREVLPVSRASDEHRFVLQAVNWDFYDQFLNLLGDRPAIRVTYREGTLELMGTSPIHEVYSRFLGLFVSLMALELELDIEVKAGGRTTFRRKDKDRGLEPDDCFWIRNAAKLRSRRTIDLSRDPPPDLAIEIDITRSFLDRIEIYSALKVPEVWCFNGETLRSYQLNRLGRYELKKRSLAFPFLPLGELVPFLHEAEESSDNVVTRDFIAWVRQRLVPLYKRNGS